MKKNLALLAGIVFVCTILVTAGCKSAVAPPQDPDDLSEVTIYLKDTIIKGDHHLVMYDSHNLGKKVIDTLTTDVDPGAKVTWKVAPESRIRKIVKVVPKHGPGKIIPGPATGIHPRKKKLKVPQDAPKPSTSEEYNIRYKAEDGKIVLIDPQLKIPPR